ncbi:MAG: radical SAM protein [Candidatus ainarchaeum sp.]|nr:radical SAM protein [Candidatus ainarchaeum sp.]
MDKIFENKEIAELFLPFIEKGFPSRKTFGKKFVNGFKHWHFTEEEIARANKNGRLLVLDLEFGTACSLRCQYCYRNMDSRDIGSPLSLDEWKNLVDQAKKLGVGAVKLIGAGEFFEDPRFFEALNCLLDKKIKVVLFTNGHALADDSLAKKYQQKTSEEIIDYLFRKDVGVFIKGDSFKPKVMDKIVNYPGYAKLRNTALKKLIEKGFASESPTRLGLEVQVTKQTYPELLDIDKLKYYLNIYPDMVTSMPCGNYFQRQKENQVIDVSYAKKLELYKKIYEQNRLLDIPFNAVSPFIGGLNCTQLGYGLYINVRGQVFACPGKFQNLGNVRDKPLEEIWENHAEKKKFKEAYFCPPRTENQIIQKEMIAKMNSKFGLTTPEN